MAQLIASSLRAGSPNVIEYMTNASVSTSVRPTTPAMPVRTVATTSDLEKKKIMYAESARFGTRSAFETTTTIVTSAVIRSMRAQRSGVSVSSSRRSITARTERPPAGSTCVTALASIMLHDHDRRGADAHQFLGRIGEGDPDGKPLRDADPVEVALDGRNAGDAEVVELGHRGSDALHGPAEMHPGGAHDVADHAIPGTDLPELRLAEIGDDEPLRRVDQREQRLDRADHLADGRRHPYDPSSERRANDRVPQIALGEADQRAGSLELRDQRVGIADRLAHLSRRVQSTHQLARSRLARSPRQIDLFVRDIAVRQERLHADERVARLLETRSGRRGIRIRDGDRGHLRRDGPVREIDLRLDRADLRFCLRKREQVPLLIDGEEHVAFANHGVVLHVEGSDQAGDFRDHLDRVGGDDRVRRARPHVETMQDDDRESGGHERRERQDHPRCRPSLPFRHPGVHLASVPAEPDERGDGERDAGIEDQWHAYEPAGVERGNDFESDDRAPNADQGAQHPGWEERPEDVERRAMHALPATTESMPEPLT